MSRTPPRSRAWNGGVTRAGQVKSSRTAHLKDDRRDLTNPRFWTIGVDAAQRLDQVSQEVDRLRRREREVNAQLEDLTRRTRQMQERRDACLRAAESTWEEVDVTTASGIVADLEAQCGRLTQDLPGLVELDTRLEAARVAEEQARERHISLRANLKQQRSRLEEATKELERLAVEDEPDLDESLSEELDKRFRSRKRHPTLDEIGQVATSVTRELSQERQRALRQENEALRDAVSIMVRFGEQWPAAGADVRPEPAYLDDHLRSSRIYALTTCRVMSGGSPSSSNRSRARISASSPARSAAPSARSAPGSARSTMRSRTPSTHPATTCASRSPNAGCPSSQTSWQISPRSRQAPWTWPMRRSRRPRRASSCSTR